MANDVTVRFGGDMSGLNATLAQARTNILSFSPVATAQARAGLDQFNTAMRDARARSDEATGGWRENLSALADLTIVLRGAYDATDYFARHLVPSKEAIEGVRVISDTVTGTISGLNQAYDSASDSVSRYFTSVAYAERSTRLFEQANDGLRASIGRVILEADRAIDRIRLYYDGITGTEIAAIAAAGGLDRFIEQIGRTSGAGAAKEALIGFTAELMRIPGLSEEAAAKIEVMLATIPNYSTSSNDILVNLLQTISRTGDEAVANAKKIVDAFKDDKNGGKILGDLTGTLKNLDDVQILATHIASSLQPSQASAYFDTLIAKLRAQSVLQQTIVDQNDAALQKVPLVGGALKSVYEYTSGAADKQKDFANAVTIATANLEAQKRAFDGILAAQRQQVEYEKLLADETTRVSQLEQAKNNIATLKTRSAPADFTQTSDAAQLIRTFEGFISTAKMDSDGRYRVGYGSDTVTSATGQVSRVTATTTTTMEDANRDLARRVGEFTEELRNRIGPAFDKLSPEAQASLTSTAYNYGTPRLPASVVAAAKAGDDAALANAIGNQTSNPSRRAQEAANIGGSDEQEKINQRLQEQYDKIRQINDAKAGGTVADQAALAIATENAVATKDEVANAEKMLAAKQKDRANAEGGSPSAVLAADKAVAEAEQTLRDKQVAAEKSAADLRAAAFRDGSQRKMEILNAELTAEQAQYVQGSAKWNDLERQKVTNLRQYQDAQRTATLDAENAKFDAQKRGFAEEQELIKARATLTGEMRAEDYAQLAGVLERQAEAERAHYTSLQQLYADDPKQYAKYAMLKTQVDAQEHARMLQNNLAFQQQLVQTYRSSFEQIGSTVSSTLMQIIQRQATWKDLMRNVVLAIIQQFIEARIKIVADWAAGQVAQVAATASAEGAKTSATALGTAARSDLLGAATAVQTAQIGLGVIKSITASAAETFAGIFGFLSPVMGPLAAGPAAAGQATVAGVASLVKFDVGSWSLPGDMVAQVHAGEMIVPAAQTPWAQSLMTAAAGGSGAGGGDKHYWSVQAVDAPSFMGLIKRNGADVAKELGKAVRRNPSIRR